MMTTTILAGKLFNPESLEFISNQLIIVSQASGRVVDVRCRADYLNEAVDIDLSHLTVLPGLIDVHVHLFLHAYNETAWDDQNTKESLVERTVRATNHARDTLMAGFTTVRDLGTEGAEDADLQLRKCLSGPNPIIPGPRYFCANRAIIASGSYGPRSTLHLHQDGVEGVCGAQFADGVDECVKAVRKQVGAGADWVKIYADYRVRARTADVSRSAATKAIRTFNNSELEAMITASHQLGVKVAAHSQNAEVLAHLFTQTSINSVEHGSLLHKINMQLIKDSSAIWVPTLSVFYKSAQWSKDTTVWHHACKSFKAALAAGVQNIACGGDTGAFAHGENALELKLMARLGAPLRTVLRWATLGGWECIKPMDDVDLPPANVRMSDHEVPFGVVKPLWSADLIALEGNLEEDFERTLDRVSFVMKMGRVYKMDGKPVY